MNLKREDKLEQVERVVQSRTLQGSENLRSFLKYVALKSIEESTDHLKEYTIATQVFGRRDDFSPRNDSVVRVQAKRLRDKLQEYYATEGRSDKILIELPKGHYNPVFSILKSATSQPVLEESRPTDQKMLEVGSLPRRTDSSKNRWITALALVTVLISVTAVFLIIQNRSLRDQMGEAAFRKAVEKYGPVWQPFLEGTDPTLLVLSNPAVYRFTNPMDPDALLEKAITLSNDQIKHTGEVVGQSLMLKSSLGRIVLCPDEFTGMGEAIGMAGMTAPFGAVDKVAVIKQSRTVSPEDLKSHNVILLGSVWVNEWSGKLPINEHFVHNPAATIKNTNPQPGEEPEYRPEFDNGKLIGDYGLITVKPNISFRNTVMVIAGIHSEGTQAAAEYVTNVDYLKTLNDRLRQMGGNSGPPKYYQALLKVAVDNGIPTTISLLSVHELKAQRD